MAWIKTIPPEEASGELKRLYEEAVRRAGRIFNIIRVQSLNPAVLAASTQLYTTLMHGPGSLTLLVSSSERDGVTRWLPGRAMLANPRTQ